MEESSSQPTTSVPPLQQLPASVIPTLKVVPFSDWDEWISVRNQLLSNHIDEQHHGIEVVKLWRSRGNVPHSVDLTAQLLDVRLSDPATYSNSSSSVVGTAMKNKKTLLDAHQLRLLYSITIVRAVNGLVDPGQQSYFAQSVLLLAERLGLPGWIVELRHDSTHKQLPSLSVLRAACDYMITWYKNNYWEPQLAYLQVLSQSCIPNVSEENELATKAWIGMLLKNSNSHCFLVDLFLPIFITALVYTPYSESLKDEYNAADRVFQSQEQLWMPFLTALVEEHTTLWIHAAICRMLSSAHDIISNFDSNVSNTYEVKFRLKLIVNWMKQFMKLIEDKLSSKVELLHMERVYFTEALIVQLEISFTNHLLTLQQERIELFEQLREYLSLIYTAGGELKGFLHDWWIQDSNSLLNSTSLLLINNTNNSSSKKNAKKQSIPAASVVEPPTKRIKYADIGKQPITSIATVDNMPMWPIGFSPGKYQNSELLNLRVVSRK